MTDPAWAAMRASTAARIGLARSGASLGTAPLLEFRLAHARARDAVHHDLVAPELIAPDLAGLGLPVVSVHSQAADRRTYLMRPDLGRLLAGPETLAAYPGPYDLAIVVADGLSALAAERHAGPLLTLLLPVLGGWTLTPLVVARQARVALGDAAAAATGAAAVLVLIGERPGLSAPDSLGAYLTWAPHPGTTDAGRNCVSNIRPDGLAYQDAARILAFLLNRMRAIGGSGLLLKDDSERPALAALQHPGDAAIVEPRSVS